MDNSLVSLPAETANKADPRFHADFKDARAGECDLIGAAGQYLAALFTSTRLSQASNCLPWTPLPRRQDFLPAFAMAKFTAATAPSYWTTNGAALGYHELLPSFGPPGWRFSGVIAQGGGAAPDPFISVIGGLFPIALWGRTSL